MRDAISMPRQKVSNLINAIEQGKVSDEEFAIPKRLVEKRGREAAQVTVTPVDTVQYCSPSPQTPEPSPEVLFIWRTTRGGWTQSEASLNHHRLVRVLKRPDSSVPRTRGRGRKDEPIADGYLLVDVGSNQGGDISSPTTERVETRAVITTANIIFLQQGHKPKDKDKGREENKQFDPGGNGEKAPLWKSAVLYLSFFCGERWAMGGSLLVLRVFVFVCVILLCSLIIVPFR